MKHFSLPHGQMPALGLGTWKSAPGAVGAAVAEAIRLGYRHVDCAPIYGNEPEIGQALTEVMAEEGLARADVWLTSKLWNDAHQPERVEPALRQTLTDLRVDYLDLFLVHWPVSLRSGVMFPRTAADFLSPTDVPLRETWAALEACVDAGLCRHIGVSNFSVRRLKELLPAARVRPVVNQVERHPLLSQPGLLDFCRREGIIVTAYSPLGSGDRHASLRKADEPRLLEHSTVAKVAATAGGTPAQTLLAWGLQSGTAVIPKSTNPQRLAENLASTALTLTEAQMAQLDALNAGYRYVDGSFWATEGSPYTLEYLWGA